MPVSDVESAWEEDEATGDTPVSSASSSPGPEPKPPMTKTKVGHVARFLSHRLLHGTASERDVVNRLRRQGRPVSGEKLKDVTTHVVLMQYRHSQSHLRGADSSCHWHDKSRQTTITRPISREFVVQSMISGATVLHKSVVLDTQMNTDCMVTCRI